MRSRRHELDPPLVVNYASSVIIKLQRGEELRFIVPTRHQWTSVTLREGTLEYYGVPLTVMRPLIINGPASVVLHTWHGGTVKVYGRMTNCHVNPRSALNLYFRYFERFRRIQILAASRNLHALNVMVVGEPSVGKHTLCRYLATWALRWRTCPIVVNLDPSKGYYTIPGTIEAWYAKNPVDYPQKSYDPTRVELHYGFVDQRTNLVQYDRAVGRLARHCLNLTNTVPRYKYSGIIIETPSYTGGESAKALIVDYVEHFNVTDILVIDNKKLSEKLRGFLPLSMLIIDVPRCPGVIRLNDQQRAAARQQPIDYYYFRRFGNHFNPLIIEKSFEEVRVYRVGFHIHPRFLPESMDFDANASYVVPVTIRKDLVNHMMSVAPADATPDNCLSKRIVGYVNVYAVDEVAKIIKLVTVDAKFLTHILLLNEPKYIFRPRN